MLWERDQRPGNRPGGDESGGERGRKEERRPPATLQASPEPVEAPSRQDHGRHEDQDRVTPGRAHAREPGHGVEEHRVGQRHPQPVAGHAEDRAQREDEAREAEQREVAGLGGWLGRRSGTARRRRHGARLGAARDRPPPKGGPPPPKGERRGHEAREVRLISGRQPPQRPVLGVDLQVVQQVGRGVRGHADRAAEARHGRSLREVRREPGQDQRQGHEAGREPWRTEALAPAKSPLRDLTGGEQEERRGEVERVVPAEIGLQGERGPRGEQVAPPPIAQVAEGEEEPERDELGLEQVEVRHVAPPIGAEGVEQAAKEAPLP